MILKRSNVLVFLFTLQWVSTQTRNVPLDNSSYPCLNFECVDALTNANEVDQVIIKCF